MRFTNLTRHTEIGANSYLLELGGRRLVLDCGMHPKHEGDDATPNLRLVADDSLDAILVSHSHLDHIGSLPVLMRRQPHARVFMSAPTAQLGEALLHNSVNVMTKHGGGGNGHGAASPQRAPSGPPPLFSHREADHYAQVWQPCGLRQPWSLDGERLARPEEAEVSFELFDAGHILGSTGILLRAEGQAHLLQRRREFPRPDRQPRGRFPRGGRLGGRADRRAHHGDDPGRPPRPRRG